jgi:XTP/dITP diphosphohydrolase
VKRLVVASTNAGKIREVSMALADLGDWSVESLPASMDADAIEETGYTFLENAVLKATHYSRLAGGFVLADDSGLCVDALDGRPGLHTARYAPSAEALNARVLDELQQTKDPDRRATFYCALAVAQAGNVIWSGQSELHGSIALAPVGSLGFGYDPIFIVPEFGKTLAELTAEQKNRISPRGLALVKVRQFLATV